MATLSAISQSGLNSEVVFGALSGGNSCALQQNSDSDLVLEVIASASDGDWFYTTNNATTTDYGDFPIAWPGDFGNPSASNSLSVRLRYSLETGTRVNTWANLQAQLVDSSGTALSDTITLASNITTTAWTTSSVVTFTGLNTTAGPSVWQSAKLRILIDITKSMGGDALQKRVSAAEVTGTYSAGAQSLTQNTRFDNPAQTFYAPTVAPGAIALVAARYDNPAQTFYAATVGFPPNDVTHAQSVDAFAQSATAQVWAELTHTQSIDAFGHTAGADVQVDTTHAHNVDAFAQSASAQAYVEASQSHSIDAFAQTATVDQPTVELAKLYWAELELPAGASNARTLTPGLFTNTSSFPAATVSAGAIGIDAPLTTNEQTFYGPTISAGGYAIAPARVENAQAFYAADVAPGAVSVDVPLVANEAQFYAPIVSPGGSVLAPERVENAQSFYAPTVQPGAVTVSAARFDSSATFYGPVVSLGGVAQWIVPDRLENDPQFYGPVVSSAQVVVDRNRRMLAVGRMMNR